MFSRDFYGKTFLRRIRIIDEGLPSANQAKNHCFESATAEKFPEQTRQGPWSQCQSSSTTYLDLAVNC